VKNQIFQNQMFQNLVILLRLDWQDTNKPVNWETDHHNIIEDFQEILDDSYNFFGQNDSRVKLTMTGTNCKGDMTVKYDKADPSAYSFSMLNNTPYSSDVYTVTVDLLIESADYDGYRCVWKKQYTEAVGSNTNTLCGSNINKGKWMSSTRVKDDGKMIRVYVNTMFNEYTYTL